MAKPHSEFKVKLVHTFTDSHLLKRALTHRSYSKDHNETLEYVGDAALDLAIASALLIRFPQAAEGELSRLRASLVKRETLAEIALENGVGEALYMGDGELASGGRSRQSILADAIEAIIGAIQLDAGFDVAEQQVLVWFKPRLEQLKLNDSKDPKTRLQEYLQAKGAPLPTYDIVDISGEQHQQLFLVRCKTEKKHSEGQGQSRRKAEQHAAQQLLELLDIK